MDQFNRLAPYIQDYIYQNRWPNLHQVQIEAIKAILDTDDNLLLSTPTASGKTEAAFLPILTDLHYHPCASVAILYISPLKALINNQFIRIDQLLKDTNFPVCKWHGDASITLKNKLINNPQGVLQITPESLESLLINKRGTCLSLFSDLRYIIIDEVHYFMDSVRGTQLLSLLLRLEKLTQVYPRRIGLSATIGDLDLASQWLNCGSFRNCYAPIIKNPPKKLRLLVQRFAKSEPTSNMITNQQLAFEQVVAQKQVLDQEQVLDHGDRAHFEYLFKMTKQLKTIIFTNSREESEFIIANLKAIASKHNHPDVYRVHHGNISAILREQTETEMKSSEQAIVTGATVTLELGIDIGTLDQVIQIGSPISVSSFAQRLGRCGRRGQVSQLLFTFVEDILANASDTLGPINWEFLRLIAIIELYIREHWVEPIQLKRYPFSILYHQLMAILKSEGELSLNQLAQRLLSFDCFKSISKEDFTILINHLLEIKHLENFESRTLLIGINGEKVVNTFNFYTVFEIPQYFLVKSENKAIGTVDKIYPIGTRFCLDATTWETIDINVNSKVIFVKQVSGISVIDWKIDFNGQIDTKVVRKIHQILATSNDYNYLSLSCQRRLIEIKSLATNSGILTNLVTPLSLHKFAIFPWVGTRQLVTLLFILNHHQIKARLVSLTSIYLEVYWDQSADLLTDLIIKIVNQTNDLNEISLPEDIQIDHKYNQYLPLELLRKEFINDYLDLEGLKDGINNPPINNLS